MKPEMVIWTSTVKASLVNSLNFYMKSYSSLCGNGNSILRHFHSLEAVSIYEEIKNVGDLHAGLCDCSSPRQEGLKRNLTLKPS